MRILLAEDDLKLGNLIQYRLEKEGYATDWVVDGTAAYEYATFEAYDVAVLDWMMPKRDGLEVCQALRKNGYNGAILLLTARDGVEDRVNGLDSGADDYLVKPFEFSELLARLRALSRRSNKALQQECCEFGKFRLDRTQKLLFCNEREVQLTPREFQILDLLVQNRGIVIPREVILERVWGLESEVTPNSLDSYMKLLRKKMGLSADVNYIHTVRGIGYRLEE